MEAVLRTARKLWTGFGALKGIEQLAEMLAPEGAVVVSDEVIEKTQAYRDFCGDLEKRLIPFVRVRIAQGEPTAEGVRTLYDESLFKNCSLVIGFGGGSVMDTAKLLTAMHDNAQLRKNPTDSALIRLKRTVTLMIPTTAATGAEATQNAVVYSDEQKAKIAVVHPLLIPEYIILDPRTMDDLPNHMVAQMAFDALAHAVECYLSTTCTPYTQCFAKEAVRLILNALPRIFEEKEVGQARQDLLLGAYFGGVCIATSSTNALHALTYPLSSRCRLSHSKAVSLLMTPMLRFYLKQCPERLGELNVRDFAGKLRAQELVEEIEGLEERCGLSHCLTAYGVEEKALPAIAREALGIKRLMEKTPCKVLQEELIEVLQAML